MRWRGIWFQNNAAIGVTFWWSSSNAGGQWDLRHVVPTEASNLYWQYVIPKTVKNKKLPISLLISCWDQKMLIKMPFMLATQRQTFLPRPCCQKKCRKTRLSIQLKKPMKHLEVFLLPPFSPKWLGTYNDLSIFKSNNCSSQRNLDLFRFLFFYFDLYNYLKSSRESSKLLTYAIEPCAH